MEFAIIYRLLERFVGLVTALRAENTQLFLSDLPEELRRRWLTALWAGYDFAHDVISALAGVSWSGLLAQDQGIEAASLGRTVSSRPSRVSNFLAHRRAANNATRPAVSVTR
jgi:hypothetical protein